jgi:hypothetical protein
MSVQSTLKFANGLDHNFRSVDPPAPSQPTAVAAWVLIDGRKVECATIEEAYRLANWDRNGVAKGKL